MSFNLKIEFGGGLELLFSNQRSHTVSIPALANKSSISTSYSTETPQSEAESLTQATQTPADVTFLLHWLKDNLLQERAELFMEGDTVRPGILVLINDTDWELEGEGDYILKDGDEIVMISTLHGG
ncbi:hypothetical protein JB92DRAFT_3118186 [Gautieria morchelliformis]|nr:hypothetical protein JB92DRAFT_3118186 [Gautieria morchelliformis]